MPSQLRTGYHHRAHRLPMFARVRGQGVHVRPSTRGPAARTAPGGLTETLGGGRGGLRTAGASPASARASGPAPSTPARPRSLRLEDACLLGPASWLEAVCRVVVGGRPSRPGLALAPARRGPHGHHAGGVPTGLNRRRARPPVDDVPAGPGVCWLPTRLPASQACSRSDSVLRRLTFVAGPAINDLRSPRTARWRTGLSRASRLHRWALAKRSPLQRPPDEDRAALGSASRTLARQTQQSRAS